MSDIRRSSDSAVSTDASRAAAETRSHAPFPPSGHVHRGTPEWRPAASHAHLVPRSVAGPTGSLSSHAGSARRRRARLDIVLADRLGRVVADPVLAAHEQHRRPRTSARGRDGVVAGAAAELDRALARSLHARASRSRTRGDIGTGGRSSRRRHSSSRPRRSAIARAAASSSSRARSRVASSWWRTSYVTRVRPAITLPTFGSFSIHPTVAVSPSVARAEPLDLEDELGGTGERVPAQAHRRVARVAGHPREVGDVRGSAPRSPSRCRPARSSSWSTGPCSMCTSR